MKTRLAAEKRNGVLMMGHANRSESNTLSEQAVHPWVRFWARTIDLCLFGLVLGLVSGLLAAFVKFDLFEEYSSILIGMIALPIWLLVEAVLLTCFGTTPGRWLLRVQITLPNGKRLPFVAALKRGFGVWLLGFGAGIPVVSIITLVSGYYHLLHHAETFWDRKGGSVVHHRKPGAVRSLVAVGFFLVVGWLFLSALIAHAKQQAELLGSMKSSTISYYESSIG